jgi:hypothetical protein
MVAVATVDVPVQSVVIAPVGEMVATVVGVMDHVPPETELKTCNRAKTLANRQTRKGRNGTRSTIHSDYNCSLATGRCMCISNSLCTYSHPCNNSGSCYR